MKIYRYPRDKVGLIYGFFGSLCVLSLFSLIWGLTRWTKESGEGEYVILTVTAVCFFWTLFLFLFLIKNLQPIGVSDKGISRFLFGFESVVGEWSRVKAIESISALAAKTGRRIQSLKIIFPDFVITIRDDICEKSRLIEDIENKIREFSPDIWNVTSVPEEMERLKRSGAEVEVRRNWGVSSVVTPSRGIFL